MRRDHWYRPVMEWGWVVTALAFVGGAVAAAKTENLWQRFESAITSRARSVHNESQLSKSSVAHVTRVVEAAYRGRSMQHVLYRMRTTSEKVRLPLISRAEFTPQEVSFESDSLLSIEQRERKDYRVNHRLVARHVKSGRRMTDDSVLYVSGGDAKHIRLGVTGYYATVSVADEVLRAIDGRRQGAIGLEDITSFESILGSEKLRPMIVGSDVTCVFTRGQTQVTALHRRSPETVNAPGAYTVSPAYVYNTNRADDITSRFGVIGYNFLREFLEEFWDDDLLANASVSPRAHPDWIFDSDHGQLLLKEVESRRVRLWCTGMAVDLTHLCLVLSLTAHFRSVEFSDLVMKAPGSSTEALPETGRPPIEFPALVGNDLESKIANMKPTTAFSIDQARLLMQPSRYVDLDPRTGR